MSHRQFDALSSTLLRGGIAPRHVQRYINELSDHYDDLLHAARKEGQPPAQAETQALSQLGAPDALAQAMLARDDLKTLSARYPISFFGFGPVITLLLSLLSVGVVLVCIALIGQAAFGAKTSADLSPDQLATLQTLQPLFNGLAWAAKFLLPVALGWLFVYRAIQQHADLRWVIMGAAIIAIVGGAADVAATLPSAPGVKGELQFGFGFFPPYPNADGSLLRSVFNFLMMAPGLWRLSQLQKNSLT